jgi:hypothetical protein
MTELNQITGCWRHTLQAAGPTNDQLMAWELGSGETWKGLTGFLVFLVACEQHFLLEGHVRIFLLTRTEREVPTRSVFTNLKLTILNISVRLSPECPFP